MIDEKRLDQKNYFQSLFLEAVRVPYFLEDEIASIQKEMITLMAKEVERYTNDESGSIRVEKAQEILASVTYSIGYFLKSTTDVTQKLDMLKKNNISELYQQGMKQVAVLYKKAEKLSKDLIREKLKINNYAYQDTIGTALPGFFHDYNIEFGAHEIPAMIDYPLYEWKEDLLGIEYIYDYLLRFTHEDRFLRYFATDRINRLLRVFATDSEHILINVFELVLNQAIGCIIAGKSCLELRITEEELKTIRYKLEGLSQDKLHKTVSQAYGQLVTELEMDEEEAVYVRSSMHKMVRAISYHIDTNSMDQLFLTQDPVKQREFFLDGPVMTDDNLRKLIEELRRINITEDKLALIRKSVKSTADMAEILDECFYDEEYTQIIGALGEDEKTILRKSLLNEYPEEYQNDYDPDKVWHRLLFGKN